MKTMKKIIYAFVLSSLLFSVSSCKKTDGQINPLSSVTNNKIGSYLVLDRTINTSLVYETAATSKVGVVVHQYKGGEAIDHIDVYATAGNSYDTTKWKFVKTVAYTGDSVEVSATGGDLAKALGITAAAFKAGSGYTFYNRIITKSGARYDVNNTGTNSGSGILGGPTYNASFTFGAFIVCGYTNMAGTYKVVTDDWADWSPGDLVTVTAGTAANTLNMSAVWPNAAYGNVLTPWTIKIDPATGSVSLGNTGAFADYGGTQVTATAISGYAFACTGQLKLTVTLGPYGNNNLVLQKQ
jgi:hypothetical protein